MILTDLFEYIGKRIRVYLNDGRVLEGVLEYIPTYSEMYQFRRVKHFYIGEESFRCHYVQKVEEI